MDAIVGSGMVKKSGLIVYNIINYGPRNYWSLWWLYSGDGNRGSWISRPVLAVAGVGGEYLHTSTAPVEGSQQRPGASEMAGAADRVEGGL
jgi:hypothetical protein